MATRSQGKGQVLAGWAFPEAHRLTEAGLLSRRFEDNGDISWFWTPQAEMALDINALHESVKRREN
jgi:hypothetical protein